MTTAVDARTDKAPLEDLMVAMDVVDTLRHRDLIIDRELDSDGRRQRLLDRLREIYSAQGIEVTDEALQAGVDALEQDRFSYTSTASGFSAKLARLYVSRNRWLKPIIGVLALGLIIWVAWYFTVGLPQARIHELLPTRIEASYSRIDAISASDAATERASTLLGQAKRALGQENYQDAENLHVQLQSLLRELETSYDIRIVSRPNEVSGVWRVPDLNPDARNYYLIVEAISSAGNVVPVNIRSEEDGRTRQRSKWGLRVSEETFEAVAADKRDDGIIQGDIVGAKQVGKLDPEYRIPTTGATIVDW
jgi:hypothetical protein